jgi:inosine-uridine nucleoside N-ribohydrolase
VKIGIASLQSVRRTAIIAALVCISCAPKVNSAGAAIRVIVDTDAGTDDLMALAFLLSRAEIELEAVTIGPGLAHAHAGAANVRRLLKLAGREDVPVYVGHATPYEGGHDFPMEWRKASDELPGVHLPSVEPEQPGETAMEFLTKRFADANRPVVLLALGGLTNLASVLDNDSPTSGIGRLVIMGGAVNVPGNVQYGGDSTNTTAEWNFYVDSYAAQRVFRSGIPITLIPLDATNQVPLDRKYVVTLRSYGSNSMAQVVAELLESMGSQLDEGEAYAWDQLAAVSIVDSAVVTTRMHTIEIRLNPPEEGRSVVTADGPERVNVALAANKGRFHEVFVSSLAAPAGRR